MPDRIPPPTDGSFVSDPAQLFSLKEWMVAISSKLDKVEAMLHNKADVGDLHAYAARVTALERVQAEREAEGRYLIPQHMQLLADVGRLKEKAQAVASVETYRRWVWGVAFVAALNTSLTILGMVAK